MGFISKLRGWWRSVSAVVGGKLHSAPSWSGGVSPSPSSAGENARAKFSQEEFRNMLIDALDDPAVARAVANRLALPTFPIKGGTCPNVTTSAAVTTGYLPYFDSGAGCTVKDSIVFEDATNSRIGIGRTNPQQKLDVYQAGGSTRIQVFADQSLSPGFRIQQNTRQAIDLYNPVDSDGFRIWVNGAARAAILANGNFGIGTTAPLSNLDVAGGVGIGSYAGANAAPSNGLIVSGNVGIGTTSPSAALQVKSSGEAIWIEADDNVGRLGFKKTAAASAANVIYRQTGDLTVLRNFTQDYTLLKVWAPEESGTFPTGNREATLTLQRATDDEANAEFIDLYNDYYPPPASPALQQYGVRIQKRGTGVYRDFVFSQYDGSTETNIMALKADAKVGIGTTNPQTLLDVAGQARVKPVLLSALPAASSSIEGAIAAVTDSTTNTWGATITGGGANHVLAYCDGTNWTVAGK